MYITNARFMPSTTTVLISSGTRSEFPLVRTWLPTEWKLQAGRAPTGPFGVVAILWGEP